MCVLLDFLEMKVLEQKFSTMKIRRHWYSTLTETSAWTNGSKILRRSSTEKCGQMPWGWHNKLDRILCFAACVRCLEVIT